MWTVGASGPTVRQGSHLLLPLHLGLNWDQWRVNNPSGDPNSQGIDPGVVLTIEYVGADGRSHGLKTWSSLDGLPELLVEVGTVYPPLNVLETHAAVNVPDSLEAIDGVWRITNSVGESVFIAAA